VHHPRDSDELELLLGDVVVRIPWDGVTPRSLTKAWKTRMLEAAPTGGPILNDSIQVEMFLEGTPL